MKTKTKLKKAVALKREISGLYEKLNKIVEELAAEGFQKEVIEYEDECLTVSIQDNMQDEGLYGAYVYISRYSLKTYKRKNGSK